MEESRTAEDNLYVVEGMQFDRGYISPYFITDPERMVRLLLKPVLVADGSKSLCVYLAKQSSNSSNPFEGSYHGGREFCCFCCIVT